MAFPKALLIDLDDTLYEERSYVESGFRAVADYLEAERDLPADYSYPSMLAFLELEGRGKVFDRIIERFEVRNADGLVSKCVEVYRDHTPTITVYEGVKVALGELSRDFKLGLVTNGFPLMQRHKLDALGIGAHFSSLVFCDEISAPKPSPAGLEQALRQLGAGPEEAVFVGDNPATDGAAAAALGIPFIRVKTARFAVHALEGVPEIDHFSDLPAFLAREQTL